MVDICLVVSMRIRKINKSNVLSAHAVNAIFMSMQIDLGSYPDQYRS